MGAENTKLSKVESEELEATNLNHGEILILNNFTESVSVAVHLAKDIREGESVVGWVKRVIKERDEARAATNEIAAAANRNTVEQIVLRLKALKRYDVGCGDDGGGYMYDYQDESPSGDWVEASDVDELIEWIQQNTALKGADEGGVP